MGEDVANVVVLPKMIDPMIAGDIYPITPVIITDDLLPEEPELDKEDTSTVEKEGVIVIDDADT